LEISGFEKLQVRRTDLTSSSETPRTSCSSTRDERDGPVIFGVSMTGVREVHKSFLEYRNVSALNSSVLL
ncbi:hypothetical protein ALC62_10150, partial [Cyphomyrmex costatus]